MSDEPLDLERSAFLVQMKQEIERLEDRVEELEEEQEEGDGPTLAEDLHSVIEQNADIVNVNVADTAIEFGLSDDRTVQIPIRWSWRLQNASPDERQKYEIVDDGNRVIWPDVEEVITVHGILTGDPAPRPEEQ